jgi:ubiquinone/menaquinone biosynthesis C-methylase UbiE
MPPSIVSMFREVTAPYKGLNSWAYDRFVGGPGAKLFAQLLMPLLQRLPADAHVLDVGCGGGHLLAQIAASNPGFRLRGIDLSASQVTRARKRTSRFGGRVSIDVGSALDLSYDDETFDAVLSIASIKHWPDWERGLREMLRVLRPGGEIYVAEADRGCRLDDARRFMAALQIPAPLRKLLLPFMRTYVLGQGWALHEARNLLEKLSLRQGCVECLVDLPILALAGKK